MNQSYEYRQPLCTRPAAKPNHEVNSLVPIWILSSNFHMDYPFISGLWSFFSCLGRLDKHHSSWSVFIASILVSFSGAWVGRSEAPWSFQTRSVETPLVGPKLGRSKHSWLLRTWSVEAPLVVPNLVDLKLPWPVKTWSVKTWSSSSPIGQNWSVAFRQTWSVVLFPPVGQNLVGFSWSFISTPKPAPFQQAIFASRRRFRPI